ncbi:MAG: polysaccharide biosynthesis tyrosine autokinase [Alphaproteobacteria bacterium]|nr:polysaccharide biosynthesis tyrosine autokinase [Alphaproteobacteria bacterium]MBP7763068.1 polysaccharide biosynthesis tyrosine autokinase [Alphaproteobacteria bacterium]MBP7905236.1 polysaccharide biosynthesis tyrosine autokinase [Alphaproteobacteria bacterium]
MERRRLDKRNSSDDIQIPNIVEILKIIYRRRWILLILMALPMIATLFYLKQKPDVYQATASVVLETQEINLTDFNDILSEMKFDNLTVPTQVQVISSPGLIRQTIETLGLQEDEKGRLYIPGESVTPPPITDADASTGRYHLIKNFLGNMEVKQQGTSRVIEISFRSFDPQLATQIANTHTKQYVFSREQDKKRIAEKLDKWLTDEIRDLKEESLKKSRAVQQFRSDNGMIQGKNSQELIYEQISDLAGKLAEIDNRVLDLQARNEMVQSGSTHGITDIVESRLVQDLKSRASVAAQKLQSLRAELGSNHPEVIAARQEVSQINGDIAREVANIRKSIENELTTVTKQKSLLEANLVKLQKQADELQEKLITLQALQMEEQSSSKLLDNFLARSEEIKSQIDFTRPDVSIVSLADIPGDPVGSKKLLIMLAVTAFSGFFAMAVIMFLEVGHQGIKTREDIYKLSGFDLLGTLPRARLPISDVLKKDRSHYVEEIKRIFIHLNAQENGKTILFTSARRGEGKTTVAASIAYYMNNIGLKTLLIDADTLAPVIAGVAMVREHPGFFELMAGKKSLQDVIVKDKHGLSIIPCGEPNPYISDLLLAGKLEKPLEILKDQYDCIIFDGCPVLGVSDAEILAGMVDQVVMVLESGKTPREEFVKAAEILRSLARNMPHVILNKIKLSDMQAH